MRAALIATALALFGCATGPRRPPIAITPVELSAQGRQIEGRTVMVSGYFRYDTDTRALWQSREAYRDVATWRHGRDFNYWSQCITVYSSGPDLSRFAGRYVRFTGRVEIVPEDDVRSLWTCNEVALHVRLARFR
jgi:hypothetical protein